MLLNPLKRYITLQKCWIPTFTTLLFLIFSFSIFAQNTTIHFRNGKQTFPENIENLPPIESKEIVEGFYYRFLQFEKIPTTAQITFLNQKGIQLLEYIPSKTYIVAIAKDFKTEEAQKLSIRSIQPIATDLKIGENLKTVNSSQMTSLYSLDNLYRQSDRSSSIQIILKYYKNIPQKNVLGWCENNDINVLNYNPYQNYIKASISIHQIERVAALPWISYLEIAPSVGQPDDTEGRATHRSNLLDSRLRGGRQYDGRGVNVLVRDDGFIGEHIDFKNRIDQSLAPRNTGAHGDGVAGIIAGGGNINPDVEGMARAAFIYNLPYESTFLDETVDLHVENQVMITNSSYSNECNVFLPNTQIVDQQMNEFLSLLHVFSAGNSNGTDCDYGAGEDWGNITGGHKQAKNVLTVANVFPNGALSTSSSRGPAYDGRIKPDIAANGSGQQSTGETYGYQDFGGTSAAAPSVSGVSAQLYQAYREMNNGENPEAALIKACLLNTANDLGQPGPDFKFGWGQINAFRAVQVLEEGRFFKGELGQNDLMQHNIIVPEGVRELRVMVYWSDVAASEMAAKALVNNLDAKIIDLENHSHLPLILNSHPDPNLLDLPAVEGRDDLNNMEQIRIQNPIAGFQALLIEGTEIPFGQTAYTVVYEFIRDEIMLTYPYGGESLESDKPTLIHWDAYGQEGEFLIEYSIDNGQTWTALATVAGTERNYEWLVPAFVTGQAKIRISRQGITAENEHPFSIISVPTHLRVHQACPDYLHIGWDEVLGATDYTVYYLGEEYMDSIGTTTALFYEIPISSPFDFDNWFAVSANGIDGAKGQRTVAKSWIAELRDCVQEHDLKMDLIFSPSTDITTLCDTPYEEILEVKVLNKGLVMEDSISFGFQINDQTPIIEMSNVTLGTNDTLIYTFQNPVQIDTSGIYELKAWVNIPSETAHFNDTLRTIFKVLIYDDGDTLAIKETFENRPTFPVDWVINNPDTSLTWLDARTIGRNGQITHAMMMDNFNYGIGQIGQHDRIQMSSIDLSNTDQPVLVFDLAYTYYTNQHWDTLSVEISTDCGASFTTVYEKTKDELATVEPSILRFEPQQTSDWRREIIDLTDYIGQSIFIRFVNKTGWGNTLYLDDIEVLEYEEVKGHFLDLKNINEPHQNTIFSCEESYQQYVSIDVQNFDIQAVSGFVVAYQIDDNIPVKDTITDIVESNTTYQHLFSRPVSLTSENRYRLTTWVNKIGEEERFRDSSMVVFDLIFPTDFGLSLNVMEDFEGAENLPEGWLIRNLDEDITWEKTNVIGSDGQATHAMFLENFKYNELGMEDVLQLPLLDLTVSEGDVAALYFDVAYTYKNVGLRDALRVDVSTDCGQTFETIFYKEAAELATTAASSNAFVPNAANDWRTEVLNLSTYMDDQVIIRMTNINGFGNNLYLDNFEVKALDFEAPMADFTASETTLCPGDLVFFTDLSLGENVSYFWNFGTGATMPTSTSSGSQVLSFQEGGEQEVTLIVSNAAGADTATILMDIVSVPQAGFSFSQVGNTVFFENLSNDTTQVIWNFGDGTLSENIHPSHQYAASGIYTVTLTVVNDCGEDMASQVVIVMISSIGDVYENEDVLLYPNPTTDVFYLTIKSEQVKKMTTRLLNLEGRVLLEKRLNVEKGSTAHRFDLMDVEAGVYVLELRTETASRFLKVVRF